MRGALLISNLDRFAMRHTGECGTGERGQKRH
jgi:hypothetical protein